MFSGIKAVRRSTTNCWPVADVQHDSGPRLQGQGRRVAGDALDGHGRLARRVQGARRSPLVHSHRGACVTVERPLTPAAHRSVRPPAGRSRRRRRSLGQLSRLPCSIAVQSRARPSRGLFGGKQRPRHAGHTIASCRPRLSLWHDTMGPRARPLNRSLGLFLRSRGLCRIGFVETWRSALSSTGRSQRRMTASIQHHRAG